VAMSSISWLAFPNIAYFVRGALGASLTRNKLNLQQAADKLQKNKHSQGPLAKMLQTGKCIKVIHQSWSGIPKVEVSAYASVGWQDVSKARGKSSAGVGLGAAAKLPHT
jgi:hypothetical protein